MSLRQQRVSVLSLQQQKYLRSMVIPVPKKHNVDDFRPVALTALVMKCFEKLFKREIKQRTQRSLEDAVVTLLHLVLQHSDKPKTFAFASAFNSIF